MMSPAPQPHEPIDVQWEDAPRRVAVFTDLRLQDCNIGDSSAHEARAIRFGTIENKVSMMHLRVQDLEPVLEHLRAYVADGTLPPEIEFRDWNLRKCILRPSEANSGMIEIGVIADRHSGNRRCVPVEGGLMTLNREHLEELLPNINSFIAHGSVRPDINPAG